MNERDSEIVFDSISKTYRRGKLSVEVLKNVDCTIAKGEFLAIMGPSGSGKTTMLNLMAGLDSPTSGRIVVRDKRLDQLSKTDLADWRSRNVGFVFQFYNLLPTLNALANVEVPLLLTKLGARERERRANLALELVGLSDRKKHRPQEMSGGEQQRVAIARAIVADPPLLVCDEPTGDLDRQNALEILALLKAIHKQQGKTIVMVTHDLNAASAASRIVSMDKGHLAAGIDSPTMRSAPAA